MHSWSLNVSRKRLLVVVVTVLSVGALLFYGFRGKIMSEKLGTRQITALLSGGLDLPLAPENISTIALYQIHLNLWDTLVSLHGEPAAAKLIDISEQGKVFRFEILPGTSFSNGRKMISDDVVFSIQRLMDKQPGGHFNAKSAIEKIEVISQRQLKIVLNKPTPAFLFLLSTPEMGIVPKEACDKDGNIKDLSVTSGAYVVDGAPQADRIALKKNPYFKKNDLGSPDSLTVLFRDEVVAKVPGFNPEDTDFVEVYDSTGIPLFRKMKENSKFSYKATRPSCSVFLMTNVKTLPKAQRIALASVINENIGKHFKFDPDMEVGSHEVLPPGTFGSLGLKSALVKGQTGILPRKLRVGVTDKNSPFVRSLFAILEEAKIELEVAKYGNSDDYDLTIMAQGMNSDYPEIEFYLNMVSPWAFIPASEDEKALIVRTIHTDDSKLRSTALQKIGSDLLADGRVIPILVRSYVHLYRKEKIDLEHLTNYDGDVPFWKMRVLPR